MTANSKFAVEFSNGKVKVIRVEAGYSRLGLVRSRGRTRGAGRILEGC